jgi:hypothetical protein
VTEEKTLAAFSVSQHVASMWLQAVRDLHEAMAQADAFAAADKWQSAQSLQMWQDIDSSSNRSSSPFEGVPVSGDKLLIQLVHLACIGAASEDGCRILQSQL